MDAETGCRSALSRRCHPACVACGSTRPDGMGLQFAAEPDGSVVAEFGCSASFQGYPDRLHGGVAAMLLDAAMTHCLFGRGVAGVTAKLGIRYRHGVLLGVPARVRARIVSVASPLYYLEAEVMQAGQVCVVAKGTFCDAESAVSIGEDDPEC